MRPRLLTHVSLRPGEGSLLPLWQFRCDAGKRKHVTSLCWSSLYADQFAVGYGSFHFAKQGAGAVAVFSLKNPSHPELTISTESGALYPDARDAHAGMAAHAAGACSRRAVHPLAEAPSTPCTCPAVPAAAPPHPAPGVMALHFHPSLPNLLAVGCYDGSVLVYDVRCHTSAPLYRASPKARRHTDPVWQLVWQVGAGAAGCAAVTRMQLAVLPCGSSAALNLLLILCRHCCCGAHPHPRTHPAG